MTRRNSSPLNDILTINKVKRLQLESRSGKEVTARNLEASSGDLAAEARVVISDVLAAPILEKSREFRFKCVFATGSISPRAWERKQKKSLENVARRCVHLVVLAGCMPC